MKPQGSPANVGPQCSVEQPVRMPSRAGDLESVANQLAQMANYVLHHVHRPGQCQEIARAWSAPDAPAAPRQREFFSYCRSGDHGGFMAVEAESPEAALALLPPLLRPTTRVYQGEKLRIDPAR
jgi:hypothetical protein